MGLSWVEFLGPLTTMLAAGAATFFAAKQVEVARISARSAAMQARLVLFREQFRIYEATRDFVPASVGGGTPED